MSKASTAIAGVELLAELEPGGPGGELAGQASKASTAIAGVELLAELEPGGPAWTVTGVDQGELAGQVSKASTAIAGVELLAELEPAGGPVTGPGVRALPPSTEINRGPSTAQRLHPRKNAILESRPFSNDRLFPDENVGLI